MTAHEIIQQFGGIGALHEITGASRAAVEQWKRIGVPAKYWHILVEAAPERGVPEISFEQLKATKPTSPRRRAA